MDAEVRVVHVDNDPSFAETTVARIEGMESDVQVTSVRTAEEGMTHLASHDADCVVSAYDMPGMDGLEFLETVRSEFPDLPFVLFTGGGNEAVAGKAIEADVSGYVRKGQSDAFDVLTDRVHSAVAEYRTANRGGNGEYRRRLYEIVSDASGSTEETCRRLLELGRQRLHLNDGTFVTRDTESDTHGKVITTRDTTEGEAADLSQTCCQQVIDEGSPIAFHHAAQASRTDGPGHEAGGPACYAGTDVIVDGERYGTICFTDTDSRRVGFSDAELTFIDLIGSGIKLRLQRRRTSETLERREDIISQVHNTVSDRSLTYESRIRTLLDIGRETLGTDYAIVSRVRGDRYKFETLQASKDEISEGDVLPVSETGCEYTIAEEELHAAADLDGDERYEDHPVHMKYGQDCYIGTPVYRDGEMHGTLCFTGHVARNRPFSDWERTLVELIGQWVTYTLEEQATEEALTRERDRFEEFASVISHDLRNPLRTALGSLELAQQTDGSEHIERAASGVERADELIEDLLELAHDTETLDTSATVELPSVAEDTWETCMTDQASLAVETDATIRADRSRVQQLLENLFRNATDHGGPDVTVTVGDCDGGFYVADDGPGISEAERERAFQSGYSTADGGTGLGLAIVKDVVADHEWSIELTDSDAGGARFEITGVQIVHND